MTQEPCKANSIFLSLCHILVGLLDCSIGLFRVEIIAIAVFFEEFMLMLLVSIHSSLVVFTVR